MVIDRARSAWNRYWAWYERNYRLNVIVTAFLFVLQLGHLTWLGLDVVLPRAVGINLWPGGIWTLILFWIDFTEIPALASVTMLYLNKIRSQYVEVGLIDAIVSKNMLYLIFVDIQVLHMFWITDAFIVDAFSASGATVLPLWLAWVAILIDYAEIPPMIETTREALTELHSD